MGTGGPLLVRQGDVALHKELTSARHHGREHTSNLPRFGPPRGVKPYSCFGGLIVEWGWRNAVQLPDRGPRRREAPARVLGCGFVNFRTLLTGAMGLLL